MSVRAAGVAVNTASSKASSLSSLRCNVLGMKLLQVPAAMRAENDLDSSRLVAKIEVRRYNIWNFAQGQATDIVSGNCGMNASE